MSALLDALMDASEDAIVGFDAAWQVTRWNRSAERVFGHRAEEVIGSPCLSLFPDHLRGEMEQVLDAVWAGDRVRQLDAEIVRQDGMPVPISISLQPVHDDGGAPVAGVLVARDITEQRLAQATLAEVEARVHESEALAHVGSWLWDVRTGAVQWSDEFHRMHGIDPLDFEGTLDAHLHLVTSADRPAVAARMAASVKSGRPFDAASAIVRADGERRRLQVRAHPMLGSDGAVVGLRGIGQDVTEGR
ncbi:MAG: PAS domain S-box protein [Acidimicrobiales bacterium]